LQSNLVVLKIKEILCFAVLSFIHLEVTAQSQEDYSHHFGGDKLEFSNFESNCEPNPFFGSTSFTLETHETAKVSIKIYNQMGYQVAEPISEIRPAGLYEINWDPGKLKLRSGVYYARLSTGDQYQLLKIRYIK
jgi:hypothetical protein